MECDLAVEAGAPGFPGFLGSAQLTFASPAPLTGRGPPSSGPSALSLPLHGPVSGLPGVASACCPWHRVPMALLSLATHCLGLLAAYNLINLSACLVHELEELGTYETDSGFPPFGCRF